MVRLILYFVSAAAIAGMLSLMVLVIFFDFKLSFIISSLLGFIFGLFSLGFTQRTLKSETLEINASNKHPQKPLKWYEERVREQIKDMRFRYAGKDEQGKELFKPRTLYRVFEPDIELEVSPYDITITASRLMIRLIVSYTEIDKVRS